MKLGEISATKPTLMRVHSECLTGDALGSARCDCGPQLNEAMRRIESEGQGVLVYMVDHEGRGIGLAEKIRAYQLQDQGLDTVDANLQLGHQADERTWEDAIAILKQLGITNIRLLTNNPSKVDVLTEEGFKVIMETLQIAPNPFSQRYLATKRDRMDHQLDNVELNVEEK
jgi:GTP cyclohydrolase II